MSRRRVWSLTTNATAAARRRHAREARRAARDEQIRGLWAAGWNRAQIARGLQVSWERIDYAVKRLNLPKQEPEPFCTRCLGECRRRSCYRCGKDLTHDLSAWEEWTDGGRRYRCSPRCEEVE